MYDVNPSACAEVAKEGAKVVKQVDELTDSDCIITMLPSNEIVLSVCQGLIG